MIKIVPRWSELHVIRFTLNPQLHVFFTPKFVARVTHFNVDRFFSFRAPYTPLEKRIIPFFDLISIGLAILELQLSKFGVRI
jgi:hypothetical protein